MKLNMEQLAKINDTLKFIISWCPYFEDYEDEMIFTDEYIKEIIEEEEDIDNIEFYFPAEPDVTKVETNEFLNLCEEIKSIEIISNGHIKTKYRSYYIIGDFGPNKHSVFVEYNDVKITHNKIKIDIVKDSFIVGLAAAKLEEYDEDGWGTISQYWAIEIVYENPAVRLTNSEELELVNSYIFEIADSTGFALSLNEIHNPMYDFEDMEAEMSDNTISELRDLEPFNEGMRLFISAVQIDDPELKFLNFYKILEHYSPIAVNIEANELMRKKLDAPKSSFENGDYIRSIFQLANSMKEKFNDEDLIKSSFNVCFDFIGLFEKLPNSIKKKIKQNIASQDLTYSTDKLKLNTAINIASKIIYKTRNKVVHSKSNYSLTGDELNADEFTELNDFMKEASSQSIRWYSRQPNHLKLEMIN